MLSILRCGVYRSCVAVAHRCVSNVAPARAWTVSNYNNVLRATSMAHDDNINVGRRSMSLLSKPAAHDQQRDIDEAMADLDKEAKTTGRLLKRRVNDVYAMIRKLNKVSSIQSLYLIRCCGSLLREETPRRRTELVEKIWDTVKSLGVPLDASHYNSLLKVYLDNGKVFSPAEFLANMERDGVEPNRVTFQRLVEKFCEDGDLSGATVIIEHMKEKKLPIGEPVFNSLLKCHAKQDDLEGARDILRVMSTAGLFPSVDTYTTLAKCFAEKGNLDQVRKTLDEAESKGLHILDSSYLEIVYKLAVSGHDEHVDEFLLKLNTVSRQLCGNVILDLLNAGKPDTALYILKKTSEKFNFDSGIILFMRHLVTADYPVEKVIEYCNTLRSQNEYVSSFAAKSALENEKLADIAKYFDLMQSHGLPIRRHYFWPLLAIHRKNNNEAGVWDTLKMMHGMAVPADNDTLVEYVFPAVDISDPTALFEHVRNAGQSEMLAIDAFFHYCCKNGLFGNAANIFKKYPARIDGTFLQRITDSFKPTSGIHEDEILSLLNAVYGNTELTIREGICDYGNAFLSLLNNKKLTPELLKKAKKMGFTLSRSSCDTLCRQVGRNDPESIQLIRDMQFGSFSSSLNNEQMTSQVHPRDMSLEELERKIREMRESGSSTRLYLASSLVLYCRNKDLQKVIETKNELDEQGFIFTPASYALMIHTCVLCGNYDEANVLKKRLDEEYPDFKLDAVKLIDYINMLFQYGKLDEGVVMMENECSELDYPGRRERLLDSVRRLLGTAAATGDIDLTKKVYKFFMGKLNVTSPIKEFADALVNVHLVKNDLDGAIAEFKNFAINNNIFPCRNKLFKKCIAENNYEKLQMVVDISTAHGGKFFSLPELALCFIETGHFQQACKTLQSVGARIDRYQIEQLCRRLLRLNKVAELEQFIAAAKILPNIDRDQLYFYLLQLYSQMNDYQKALEIWNAMQEENVQQSIKSLCLIADLLKKNDQPVPFVVPELPSSLPQEDDGYDKELAVDNDMISTLQRHLDSGNTDEVVKALSKMKKGHIRSLSVDDMKNIVDLFTKNDCLRDIIGNVQVMSYIIEKSRLIVRPLLEIHAEVGNVDCIRSLADFLPDFTLKNINYSYYYFKAHISAGKQEALLSELEQNIKKNVKMFSFAGLQELLDSAPGLEGRVSELIEMYSREASYDLPRKVLWLHNFTRGNFDKAEEIYQQYSHAFGSVDSLAMSVLKAVRSNQDEVIGQKFLDFVKDKELKQIIRDRAYSCVLDILVLKSKNAEASNLVNDVLKQNIPLNIFSETTLMTLKKLLENSGQEVTFKIPMHVEESSDSSSDSDEVVRDSKERH